MPSFSSIPILDLSLARDPETKPVFLEELRHALMEVGLIYLKNVGLPDNLTQRVIQEGIGFFDLPREEKLKIEMKNAPSFLGYSQLGAETTANATDLREQIDLSTDHAVRTPDQPLYRNLFAPTLWPSSKYLPNFHAVFTEYINRMADVSTFFTSLVAEAIGLPANAFDRFFDEDQQHKLKIIKYPDLKELNMEGQKHGQGVGPHKDSMLSSYLLQASHHTGLQVQNTQGEWIDCPPIAGTLVVAMGQGMEAVTQGTCTSTTHRVLSPAIGSGPRYSIPFFQGVSLDATFDGMDIPEETKELRRRVIAKNGERQDSVEFTFKKGKYKHLGEATLMNRIKSHPDVGERWYPELLAQIREEQALERIGKGAEKRIAESTTVVERQSAVVKAH